MKYCILCICCTREYHYENTVCSVSALSRSWPPLLGNLEQRDWYRKDGPNMGWLRSRHGMFCERTQKVVYLLSRACLGALKVLVWPKLTAVDSPIVLVLMKPEWLEWACLFVLRYCLGTCPTSVSIKSVSEDKADCCYFLRLWVYNFFFLVKGEWPSLVHSAFTDQRKEITISLVKKIKALVPPLIYLCSVLANEVQQKHCSLSLWMWNQLSFPSA